MNSFSVRRNNAIVGTFKRPQLIRMIRTGQVSGNDEVSADDSGKWVRVRESGFAPYLARAGMDQLGFATEGVAAQSDPRTGVVRQGLSSASRQEAAPSPPTPPPISPPPLAASSPFELLRPYWQIIAVIGGCFFLFVAVLLLFGPIRSCAARWSEESRSGRPKIGLVEEYRKADQMFSEFLAAVRRSHSEDPAGLANTLDEFAVRFKMQGGLVESLAADAPTPAQRADFAQYGRAVVAVAENMAGMAQCYSDPKEETFKSFFKNLAVKVSGNAGIDCNGLAGAIRHAFRQTEVLSENGRAVSLASEDALRSLEINKRIIEVKYGR